MLRGAGYAVHPAWRNPEGAFNQVRSIGLTYVVYSMRRWRRGATYAVISVLREQCGALYVVRSAGRVPQLHSVGIAFCLEGRFVGLAEVRVAKVKLGDGGGFACGSRVAVFADAALLDTRHSVWRVPAASAARHYLNPQVAQACNQARLQSTSVDSLLLIHVVILVDAGGGQRGAPEKSDRATT